MANHPRVLLPSPPAPPAEPLLRQDSAPADPAHFLFDQGIDRHRLADQRPITLDKALIALEPAALAPASLPWLRLMA